MSQIELPEPKLLDIRIYPHKDLSTVCETVTEVTPEIKALIQNMFLTMYKAGGVGLSANQVGVFHRVFVMDTSASGARRRVFINPEIVKAENLDRWGQHRSSGAQGQRPARQEEALRAVQGPGGVGRLQGRRHAPQVHERPGKDPGASCLGQLHPAPA